MGWLRLALAVVLLAGNSFFVGAQFALITARRDQIEPRARAGGRRARVTLGQMRALSTMLAGSQLGIAVCSLGLGAVAEPGIADVLEDGFDALSLPTAILHPVSIVIALIVVSYLHMVIGEMVPKNLALAGPARAALMFGPPMAGWVRMTRPLLRVLSAVTTGVMRLFRIEPKEELAGTYTATELADLIAESTAAGLIDPAAHQRLARALTLERRTARDVAVPLADLVTVSESVTPDELERLVGETGYSRFPVRSDPDGAADVAEFVHVKDIIALPHRDEPIPVRLRRPMVTIESRLPLSETLSTLRRAGSHLGRVVDGLRVVGVIALEDVLEEFVGEVVDASHHHPDVPRPMRDAG